MLSVGVFRVLFIPYPRRLGYIPELFSAKYVTIGFRADTKISVIHAGNR